MPSWFNFRSPPTRQDPSVDVVEKILDTAGKRLDRLPSQRRRVVAKNALAICACVTTDDAPKWLIYDTRGGELMWRKVPDKKETLSLVDAEFTAGGHADPAEVQRWLQREASDPWGGGGDGGGNPRVLDALLKKIN